MKVAVISTVPTLGKTTLIQVLGSVYSRSQGRDVSIFSTGNAQDNIDIITNISRSLELDSPHVFKSMVEGAAKDAKELFNYGVQSGEERVYIYDILSANMEQKTKEEFLISAINKIPSTLTLVEISGDPLSPLNRDVLSTCDCALFLLTTSIKSIKTYKEIISSDLPTNVKFNKAIVVAQYNPVVSSIKKVAQELKLKDSDLYRFPYNNMVAKHAFNGSLDKLAYNIVVTGDSEVVNLRMPIQEIMEFIFNTERNKIIRSIDKWYR